jgi:UDP-N-acetylmuramate dehydrogenase
MSFADQLSLQVKGEILREEVLSSHTSFGIGGPADFFVRPATLHGMLTVLNLTRAHQLPVMVIGRGTNLLVGDAGVRGVVLELSDACHLFREKSHGLAVGSGVTVTELLDFCVRQGWGGAEFMAGIPGSLGGAVRVNAGAWDQSIGLLVTTIGGYDFNGREVVLGSSEVRFRYRGADLPADLIITEVELNLIPTSREHIEARITEFLKRRSSQPTDQRCAGSIFKNPPGSHAGVLIEASGCKGLKVGAAEVSLKHANFIINRGGATASQVKQLIEMVRERVADQFGIELELEILFVGEG